VIRSSCAVQCTQTKDSSDNSFSYHGLWPAGGWQPNACFCCEARGQPHWKSWAATPGPLAAVKAVRARMSAKAISDNANTKQINWACTPQSCELYSSVLIGWGWEHSQQASRVDETDRAAGVVVDLDVQTKHRQVTMFSVFSSSFGASQVVIYNVFFSVKRVGKLPRLQ
jgi:hypothetical protein